MIIVFEEHGGILPYARQRKLIDTAQLSPEQAAEVGDIVNEVKATVPRVGQLAEHSRDAMTYSVQIEDNGETVQVAQTDGNISPAFSALLRWCKNIR